jgi:hypothetical protein
VRRADRSPLKFNTKLSRPFSTVPIRLSAPYCDPADEPTAKGTTLQNTDLYSLYKCLVKLGTTKEKRLMVDIFFFR